jgi:hypothetical protein
VRIDGVTIPLWLILIAIVLIWYFYFYKRRAG